MAKINWADVSEIAAGMLLAGKIPPAQLRPAMLVEPYPALVKLYQAQKRKPPKADDIIGAIGPTAYQAALAAAKAVKGLPANWVTLLERASALHETGILAERMAKKMLSGEEVDMTPLLASDLRLRKREQLLQQVSGIDSRGEDFVLTGYEPYDTHFGGLPDSAMTIVAAPPGTGKTWHQIQLMASFLALHKTKVGVIFSLEMSGKQMARRIKNSLKIPKTVQDRLYLCDDVLDVQDLVSIAARATDMAGGKPLGIVGIDFAELVLGGDSTANESEMAFVAKTLERSAIRMGLPFLLNSQLSRRYDGAFYSLTMLKYSGALESAAAMVVFLHNVSQVLLAPQNGGPTLPLEDGFGFFIQAKSRFGYKWGQTGAVKVAWNGTGWGNKSYGWSPIHL